MNKKPIFIIGCPRSGTTLLRVILDSHYNISCGPETHLIENIKKYYENIEKNWQRLKLFGISKEKYLTELGKNLSTLQENYMKKNNKKRWAEKTPTNIFHIDFINELFPDCQLINVIRDGRDVICSYKKRWGSLTIYNAVKTWNKSIDLTFQFRKKFTKEKYYEVRYEEIVSNPEIQTKKLMDFLGEKWTEDLLNHHKKHHDFLKKPDNQKEKNPQRHSPSKPIFKSSIGRWKKELNIIEKTYIKIFLKDNLEKLGYID